MATVEDSTSLTEKMEGENVVQYCVVIIGRRWYATRNSSLKDLGTPHFTICGWDLRWIREVENWEEKTLGRNFMVKRDSNNRDAEMHLMQTKNCVTIVPENKIQTLQIGYQKAMNLNFAKGCVFWFFFFSVLLFMASMEKNHHFRILIIYYIFHSIFHLL